MRTKKQRTVYEVSEVFNRRYGCGDALKEAFLNMEAFNTLETLISYGPRECGGEDSDTWKEYIEAKGRMDLSNAAMGALVSFQGICRKHGVNHDRAFEAFSEAYGYWGPDETDYETFDRVRNNARDYLKSGSRAMARIRRRNEKQDREAVLKGQSELCADYIKHLDTEIEKKRGSK